MNIFIGRADYLASAIHAEKHEQVRHILNLNAWKIQNWADYASWKKHGRSFVKIAWHKKCLASKADAEFVEVPEA
jgi:hypothetical protein